MNTAWIICENRLDIFDEINITLKSLEIVSQQLDVDLDEVISSINEMVEKEYSE